mgnify:CR=1 FL=1
MKNVILYAAFVLLLISVSSCKTAEKEPVVEPGKTITFDYAAGFTNGTLFDTSIEEAAKKAGIYNPNRAYQPVTLRYGEDPLLLGYAETLLGMKEGEVKNIIIPPGKAYGNLIENSTIKLPKARIQDQGEMRIGGVITIIGPNNEQIPAYIKEIGNENLTLDLNHPLAGHYVQFSIILRSVE